MPAASLNALASRMHSLSNATRLRVLLVLRGGTLSVCQIAATLDVPASTVSGHLADLKRGGIVSEKRKGRFVWYALRHHDDVVPWLRLVARQSAEDPQVREDLERTARIRFVPPEMIVASIKCDAGVVPVAPRRRGATRGAA